MLICILTLAAITAAVALGWVWLGLIGKYNLLGMHDW